MDSDRRNALTDQFLVIVRSGYASDHARMVFLCRDRFGDHWQELNAMELRYLAEAIDYFRAPPAKEETDRVP